MKKHILNLALLLLAGSAHATSTPAACDRVCLKGLADQLLDSMVAHDPSKLPLTQPYAATENSVPSALNMMAAWRTTTAAPASGRFYVIDPVSQQVFLVVSVKEGGNDTFLTGRLRAQDGRLAEVELYQNRSRGQGGYQFGGAGPANFPSAWTVPVERSRIPDRMTLLQHGQSVFNAGLKNLPAANGCVLMENGKVVEEHAEVAAEVAGGPPPKADANGMVPIPCGMPPERPTDPLARTSIVDEVQGIVVTQATVHGTAQPLIITTPTESAFVPDQILAPYMTMLKKQQGSGKHNAAAIRPLPATAAAAELHRVYDGKVQGQLLLVNIGAPGSRSPWTR